jgi:hypothetical protein
MSNPEEYRRRGAGCVLMAENTPDSAHRLALMEMAQAWLHLAEQAERNGHTDLVYETPERPAARPQ